MVIADILKKLSEELSSRREAELLLSDILNISIPELIFKKNQRVTPEVSEKVDDCILRRKSGEPIQYITGNTEFMSLPFKVTPNVLIPRSDTETLVELLIEKIGDKNFSLLDIGTGSGCIAISLLKYCKNLKASALDISDGALSVAKENAKLNDVSDRIEFCCLDILKDTPLNKFDCIVSNPPYIRPDVIATLDSEVKDFEPYSALYGGEDGLLFYRRICDIAPNILNKNGILAFEIGYDQGDAVKELMSRKFYNVEVIRDLCGNDRVVTGNI